MGTSETSNRIRLLLIEDDDEDALLIRHALSSGSSPLSFSVDRATTLSEAKERLNAGRYDVAVVDLSLPDSVGTNTVEMIVQEAASLPIVVVTDHQDHEVGLQTVRAGAQGFISKIEVNATTLVREIGHAVERQQLRKELADHRDNLETLVEERTQELRDAVDRLQEHDQARTDFVFNVSHELRTPLTSMIYTVENILDGAIGHVSDRVRESLSMLNDDCQRLKRTVEDILDISRIDTGQFEMQNVPISTIRFMNHVVSALAGNAHMSGVSLTSLVETDPLFVLGDPDKLARSLYNLIQNAIKYSSRGDVIEVRLTMDPTNESRIAYRVTDNGPGIPEVHLDHVTKRYYRVGDHFEGTGLGLPIVKQLVEHHGGELTIISPPENRQKGTQASILLPISEAPRILVVDDEELVTKLLHRQLSREGYRVDTCKDGVQALDKMNEETPDLIVLDLNMPNMSGVSLTSHIKSSPELRHIIIVALTGGQIDKSTEEVLEGFAIPLLLKPVQPEELNRLIENQLLGPYGRKAQSV